MMTAGVNHTPRRIIAARIRLRKHMTQAVCEKNPTMMAIEVSVLPGYRCTRGKTILASATATTTFRSSSAGWVVLVEYSPIVQNNAIGTISHPISGTDIEGTAEKGSSPVARNEATSNAP